MHSPASAIDRDVRYEASMRSHFPLTLCTILMGESLMVSRIEARTLGWMEITFNDGMALIMQPQ